MKLVDLINMAARGEKMPHAIRLKAHTKTGFMEYCYDEDYGDYFDATGASITWWTGLFQLHRFLSKKLLNTECEVIDENE